VLFFASCSPGVDRKEAPENLVKKDEMVNVLTELMKLEGHASLQYVQVTRYDKMIDASADSLFKVNGITAKQFETSFDYYAHQQEDLKEIYDAVLDRLNHEMTDLELKEENDRKTKPTSKPAVK
jgi:hypothetical protein